MFVLVIGVWCYLQLVVVICCYLLFVFRCRIW